MKTVFKMLALAGTVAFATTAEASPLQLVDVVSGNEVQQTSNRPCVFGDNSCDPGLLGTYTVFPTAGNPTEYTETQSYTVGTVRNAVTDSFNIGIDVNTTSAASEILDYFKSCETSSLPVAQKELSDLSLELEQLKIMRIKFLSVFGM